LVFKLLKGHLCLPPGFCNGMPWRILDMAAYCPGCRFCRCILASIKGSLCPGYALGGCDSPRSLPPKQKTAVVFRFRCRNFQGQIL
jgi:hypothetical protein